MVRLINNAHSNYIKTDNIPIMQDQIIIRIPADETDNFSWVMRSSANSSPEIGRGSLDELASAVVGFKVVVLVPGADVTLQHITVPTQNKQRMLKAIPYAKEDEIIPDVESLHFALAKVEAKDSVSVAIVERQLMDQWQAMFQNAGIAVDIMMPDTMALPFHTADDGDEVNIVIEESAALFKTGVYQAFYVDLDNLNFMLKLWLNERVKSDEKESVANLPKSIVVWRARNDVEVIVPEEYAGVIDLEYKTAANGLLTVLVDQPINLSKNINLLQGDFSRREQMGKIWRPWRLAASLAAVLFVLQLGLAIIQSNSLETQYQALKAESKSIYKATFPDARRIVNPRQQMAQKIKELKGSDKKISVTFLSLLADTGAVFKSTQGLNLKSMRFKNNTLDVDLEVPNYEVLDELKQKLTEEGKRSVEIQSAVTRKNLVQGRLQIKGLAS